MCGICGFISDKEISRQNLIEMNATLLHRVSDDHGEEIYEISHNRYVGFAHRKLSIFDLSEKGHQPMHSPYDEDRCKGTLFESPYWIMSRGHKDQNQHKWRDQARLVGQDNK